VRRGWHTRLRAMRRHMGRHPLVVYRWDLDKTYLRTDFDTVRQLLRVPFERPEDKVEVPGVVELIRSLKPCAEQAGRAAQILFLSASPPQIGKAIRAKLALDEVPYDGIVFKNQLRYLVRGKFRNLREQVGFKLSELLRSRHALPADAEEVLFGDDWESDAVTYSIYADTLAGRIDLLSLRALLTRVRVDAKIREEVLGLASSVPKADAVCRIFVNLERRTPPVNFRALGPRVVPTFNYLQTAAVLYADGYIDDQGVAAVARSLAADAGYSAERMLNSIADLSRRGHLGQGEAVLVRARLGRDGVVPQSLAGGVRERLRAWVQERLRHWRQHRRRRGRLMLGLPPRVDYDAVLGEWEGARSP